jgi:Spy/CpxP family protein refolding chaperone
MRIVSAHKTLRASYFFTQPKNAGKPLRPGWTPCQSRLSKECMMSEQHTPPATPATGQAERTPGRRRCRRGPRRWIKLGLILALIGGLALWHHQTHRGHWFAHAASTPAAMQAQLEDFSTRALDAVDASPAQRVQVGGITRNMLEELQPLIAAHRAAQASLVSALGAEHIDPALLEQLRSQMMQQADASSRSLTRSLSELGQVLSAAQRRELLAHWPAG